MKLKFIFYFHPHKLILSQTRKNTQSTTSAAVTNDKYKREQQTLFFFRCLFVTELLHLFIKYTFVSPAMGATLQTFLERRVLIMELFPTLG